MAGEVLQKPEDDCHSRRRLSDIHERVPPSSSRNLLVSAVTPMGESVLYTAFLLLQGATVQMSRQNFNFPPIFK